MIPLSRSALGRIFVYGAVILFLSGTATPQVKQSLPNHCWALDQKKASLSLVQVFRSRSKHQGEYWFHFANQSNCDVYIPTVTPSRSRTGKSVRTTRDREKVGIAYLLDGQWGWGDAPGAFRIKSGRSILFAVPRDELGGSETLCVPIAFDLKTPFTSTDVDRICLSLNQVRKLLSTDSKEK